MLGRTFENMLDSSIIWAKNQAIYFLRWIAIRLVFINIWILKAYNAAYYNISYYVLNEFEVKYFFCLLWHEKVPTYYGVIDIQKSCLIKISSLILQESISIKEKE